MHDIIDGSAGDTSVVVDFPMLFLVEDFLPSAACCRRATPA